MKKLILEICLLLMSVVVSAQHLHKCERLSNGGWQAITKDISYVAAATLSGEAITSVQRFNIFYTDEPQVTGSVLTFVIIHSENWGIPEDAEITIHLSDGASTSYKNMSNGGVSEVGSFYRSEFSMRPESKRLIFMDKIVEIEVKISDGRTLLIKPASSWSNLFAEVYFEISDALKAKGWTSDLL